MGIGYLTDKVCIVTGGAQGIGFEVAKAFASQDAKVVLADIGTRLDGDGRDSQVVQSAAEAIRAGGGACIGVDSDVTDPASTEALVGAAISEFGDLDVVVNVAGNLCRGSILEITDDAWQATFDVHVNGARNTTRAAGRYWNTRAGSHRRVINISSDAGLFGSGDYVAYAAAKAAVVGFTLSTSATMAHLGATANVFIPQASTRMTASIPFDELPDGDRWASGEFDAAHVAPALVYLASDASDAFNGQVIGGWGYEVHLYAPPRRQTSLHSTGPWDLHTLFRLIRQVFSP